MSGVICAVRGGPDSRPTINKAIDIAKATGSPLHFLYVVNLEFLSKSLSGNTNLVSTELHQMGEFILLNAQTVAEKQNVLSEIYVGQGAIGDEIIRYANEIEAETIVLGLPKGLEFTDLEETDGFKILVGRIEKETESQVEFAKPVK